LDVTKARVPAIDELHVGKLDGDDTVSATEYTLSVGWESDVVGALVVAAFSEQPRVNAPSSAQAAVEKRIPGVRIKIVLSSCHSSFLHRGDRTRQAPQDDPPTPWKKRLVRNCFSTLS
jgi:hypothetical protein